MEGMSQEQRMILDGVRRLTREKIAPLAREVDEKGEFNWHIARLFAEMGLLQIFLPPEYGGLKDNKCLMFSLITEEVAKVCASSALLIIIQAVGSFPIIEFADPILKDEFFKRLASGNDLVAYLVTEPGTGSDVSAIQTRAKKKKDFYIINGRKNFATNGGIASLASVLCRTGEKQLSFFVLDMNTEGVIPGKKEDKLGFRGSNTQEVILEDVRVPHENILGKEGDGFMIAMKVFDMSRPAVGALALGIAEGAIEIALNYALERETFGQPLIKHQAVAFMIADAWMMIEAGRGLVIRASKLWDQGIRNTKLASMAKCFCSDTAMKVTTDAIRSWVDMDTAKTTRWSECFVMQNSHRSLKAQIRSRRL